jgi:hypothetical protein
MFYLNIILVNQINSAQISLSIFLFLFIYTKNIKKILFMIIKNKNIH